MRIGIVARTDGDSDLEMVAKVIKYLKGEEVVLEPGLAKKIGGGAKIQDLRGCDAIVTIGGDGTVLHAQRLAPDVPILGINLGRRGFLAEVNPKDAPRALRRLREGKLPVVSRTRLATTLAGKSLPEALNDVVVSSEVPGKSVSLSVSIDGHEALDFRCDGIIVATPTGSTAYTHAAGGPVLDPRLESLVVTPICPTHPRQCSIVIPPESCVQITPTRPGRAALVIVDGEPVAKVDQGKKVEVRRSDYCARFFEWESFYRKVKEKLL
ncbi:MAG: NAD(+)/NADH kinase [Candidatus Hadarchaeum sp.]|uniref:NAD(+)/NADH kinase n=1 Tax=Candidatus Hadarchaeum sp. TaxID=2883567 RepID=UPI003D14B123